MFGLIKSVISVTKDVAEIAVAPIEVAVDLTKTVTRPVAEAVKDIKEEIKDLSK